MKFGMIRPTIRHNVLLTGCLFAGFFLLYQVSLALQSTRFHPHFTPLFGADSMEDLFIGNWRGRIGATAMWKHPLFPVVTIPLYQLGSKLYSPVPGPAGINLALAFPCALIGAINVCLSFWVFMRNCPNRRIATLFTVFYGLSAAVWVFSSVPESYALTALCTTLFLWAFLRWKDDAGSVLRLAGLNAIACYASPQQILLAIMPGVYYLQAGRWSRQSIKQVITFGLALVLLFIIPYEVFIKKAGGGYRFAEVYLNAYGDWKHFLDPPSYLVVLRSFLVFSVVGPIVRPELYADPSARVFELAGPAWLMIVGLYLVWSVGCLFALRGSTARAATLWPAILFFLTCYLGFFLFFNPEESFLYAMPMLLPLFLLLHSGFVNRPGWRWEGVLIVLLLTVAANNLRLVFFLRSLIETVRFKGG